MKQKYTKSLHYGCLITINIQDNRETYVQSDGLINPVAFLNNKNQSNVSQIFEVSSNIFRVLPAIYRPEQEKFALNSIQQFHDLQKYKQSEITQNQLKNLYQKVQAESLENNTILQNSLKKPVEFGQNIMLQHVKSQNFLSYQAQNNDNHGKQTYKLNMVELPDKYSWFNILPCYQYQASQSKYVQFGEHIYLASKINAVSTWYIGMNVQNEDFDRNQFNLQTLLLNVSQSSKFCINLYRKQVGNGEEDLKGINEQNIHFGDCVWLNYPELNSSLCYSPKQKQFSFKEQNQLGLWIIEAEGDQNGFRIKWENKLRLKSLLLNQYLEIIKDGNNHKLNLTPQKSDSTLFYVSKVSQIQSNNISEGTIVSLTNFLTQLHISTEQGDKNLLLTDKPHKYDVFRFIRPSPHELWEINFLNSIKIYIIQGIFTLKKFQEQSFQKGYENTNNELDFINIFQNDGIRCLKECIVQLKNFCRVPELGRSMFAPLREPPKQFIEKRQELINDFGFIQLITKILEVCFPDELSLTFISHVETIAINGAKLKMNLIVVQELFITVNDCYQLLQLIVKDNIKNKNVLFGNIQYFFHHFGYIKAADKCINTCIENNREIATKMFEKDLSQAYKKKKYNQIDQTDFEIDSKQLSSTINNDDRFVIQEEEFQTSQNQNIIQKYHLVNYIIDRYAKLILYQKNLSLIEFYELLNKICGAGHTSVTHNQIQVQDLLRKKQEADSFQKHTIGSLINDVLECQKDYEYIGVRIDSIYKYLQLQANFCFGRNYITRELVQKDFPFNELVIELQKNIGDSGILPDHVKAALVNIITNVYIDTRPFKEAILPRYTKKFKTQVSLKLENQSIISDSHHEDQFSINNSYYNFEINPNNKESILKILKISILYLERPNYNFGLAYSFLIFQRKLLSFKFLKLNDPDQQTLYCKLMKTLGQLCDNQRNRILAIEAKNISKAAGGGGYKTFNLLHLAANKAILKSSSIIHSKINKIKTANNNESTICEKEQGENQLNLQQDVLKEILRNFIIYLNIRFDSMIKRIIEFFNKVYMEESKIKNIDDFIKENLSKYMPGLPHLKLNGQNIDSAIFFDERGNFIGAETFILNLLDFLKLSEDSTLNFLIFKIILQICFQQTNLMSDMKRIYILQTPEDQLAQNQIKQISTSLQFDVEQSELWLVPPHLMSSNQYKYKDIIFRVREDTSKLIQLYFDKSQNQEVLMTRQIIFRNLEIQNIFLNLLKDSLSIAKQIKERNSQNQVIIQMIQNCYSFLIHFVSHNNTLNKELLYPYLNIFFESVDLIEMGQIKLLCKIYSKNNQKLEIPIPNETLNIFFDQIKINKKYKSCYIKFLGTIITNTTNQKNIIDHIITSNCIEHLLYLNSSQNFELFPLQTQNLDQFEPYIYHMEVLKLFNYIIENNQNNAGLLIKHLRKLLDFTKMIIFLSKPDIFSPNQFNYNTPELILNFLLKEQLWRLLCNMWLNYSKVQKFNQIIENMQDYNILMQLIQIESNKINLSTNSPLTRSLILQLQADKNNYENKEVYKFLCGKINISKYNEHYQYYTLVYIFPFFNAIQLLQLSEQKESQLLQIYNPYLDNFKILLENLPGQLTYQYPIFNKLSSKLQENFKKFDIFSKDQQVLVFDLKDFPARLYDIKSDTFQQKRKPIYNHLLQEILLHNKGSSNELWRSVVINLITSQYVKQEFCEKENTFFLQIISKIKNSQDLQLLIHRMNQFLVSVIQNNKLQEEKSIKNVVIEIINLLKLLIDRANQLNDQIFQFKKEQSDQKQTSNLQISLLDLGSRKKKDTQQQNPDPDDQIYYTNNQKMQQIFSQKEIIDMIISNLCIREIEDQIFDSLIDLMISILEGGNPLAQSSLYNFFTNNDQSEILFERIEYLIYQEINNLEEREDFNSKLFKSVNQLSAGSVINYSKIIKLIRFLQLLSEGHNEKLQDYIREQVNFSKNINLVQVLVDYSDKLLRNLSEQNYYKLMQCLDTLIEFIQGPCSNNQVFISKTSIIETANIILENYKPVEMQFIQYYKATNKKELEQTLLSYDSSSLLIKEQKDPQISPVTERLVKDSRVSFDRLTVTKNFTDVSLFEYKDLLSQVLGDMNPQLSIDIIEVLRQYNHQYQPWMLRRLQYKVLILLDSIIEGRKDDSILKVMKEKISFDTLIDNIYANYNQYKAIFRYDYNSQIVNNFEFFEIHPKNPSELIIENGFKIYGLMQNYQNIQLHEKSFSLDWIVSIINQMSITKKEKKTLNEALEFFHQRAGYVEVQMGDQIFPIYFPKPPYCIINNQRIFSQFQLDVDRASQKSKLDSFTTQSSQMINEMKFLNSLNEIQGFFIFSFAVKYMRLLQAILFLACLSSNIMLLLLVDNDHSFTIQELLFVRELRDQVDSGQSQVMPYLLLIFEIIQILFSFILLVVYTGVLVNKAVIELNDMALKKNVSIIKKNYFIISMVLNDGFFYIKLNYCVFSILGLFNIAFIAIQLFDIFFQVRVFHQILLSIWRPRKQFLLLFLVFFLLQYLMSIIVFYAFRDDYKFPVRNENGEITSILDTCDSMLNCFSMMCDVLFKVDGGQTGYYNQIQTKYFYSDYRLDVKSIVDFIYVLMVFLLTIDILGGLIVDTFDQLRDENNERIDDEENYCFVCGLNRKDEEKLSVYQDFDQHVNSRHNLKNYLYYMAYLNDKLQSEYTGIESFVDDKIKLKDISWFPKIDDDDDINEFASNAYVVLDQFKKEVILKLDNMDNQLERVFNQQLKQNEQVKHIKLLK